MARKTVLPCALSPEQQRALSVFLKSLSEYDSLSLVTIPRSVLPTDFRCIMKGRIPKNALVCDDHWSWNQSNAKIRTVTDNNLEVIIQKLNPRKKPDTTLKRPSYKIWILAFRKVDDVCEPELFIWCEKGLSPAGVGIEGLPQHIQETSPARPEPRQFSFLTDSYSVSLLDAMDIDSAESETDKFLRQMQQEGQVSQQSVKTESVGSLPCTDLHALPVPHYHCSEPQHGPTFHAPAPTHTRHQSLDAPFSSPMFSETAKDKRSRSLSNPVCTTKLQPLFGDISLDDSDELMMDYVTADVPYCCPASLTSVATANLVVRMEDLTFLRDFVVEQQHCPFGMQCRQR